MVNSSENKYSDYKKIETLIESDSFYIYDPAVLDHNYNLFLTDAKRIYSNINIGYSYKTNYLPEICKFIDHKGEYAEVVSEMEYELAFKYYGIKPSNIIVNGPIHSKEFIELLLNNNSIFQIDSFYMLNVVDQLCKENPTTKFNVSIRFNYTLSDAPFSRFGIEYNDSNIAKIESYLTDNENLTITGLHCHFSTGNRSVNSYVERTKSLIDIYKTHFSKYDIKYLNFGGGFFSKMPESLKAQFNSTIPTINEYSTKIAEVMKSEFPEENLTLILEPGTALTANCMDFVCKIYDLKTIQNKNIVLTNGSVHNIKPTGNAKELPCSVVNKSQDELVSKDYVITGYTCMEKDILRHEFNGSMNVDDYIVFNNIGAYTNVFKPPFIKAQIPIISLNEDNSINILKRAETTSDIINTYSV